MFAASVTRAIVAIFMFALMAMSASAVPLVKRTYTGDATFFIPATGACGITNTPTDMIAAVSVEVFDNFPGATANPNSNPICGSQLVANYQGLSVTVAVTDRCVGCDTGSIDLTEAAFRILSPVEDRIHGVTWDFI
ncbi:hypothetical protein VKT23_013169 [Stygiomarasmius scandens]|uniref:RlpA-like protein double-psi beta-barrel domain-containing protein n=1 Tax=Marasmiellus scandens TaxID=2682957 RepID=A0ABR1J949_9AGAR